MIRFQFVDGGDDPASLAIKARQHGGWTTHVDCMLSDGLLLGARSDSVGGKPPGVQIRPPGYIAVQRAEIVTLACDDDQAARWNAFLLAQLGKPYDLVDLLADFVGGRNWRNPNAWWCSELGGRSIEPDVCGYLLKPWAESDILTPWALYSATRIRSL